MRIPITIYIFVRSGSISCLRINIVRRLNSIRCVSTEQTDIVESLSFGIRTGKIQYHIICKLRFKVRVSFNTVSRVAYIGIVLQLSTCRRCHCPHIIKCQRVTFIEPVFYIQYRRVVGNFLIYIGPERVIRKTGFIFRVVNIYVHSHRIVGFLSQ